jgi:hypothetical protein
LQHGTNYLASESLLDLKSKYLYRPECHIDLQTMNPEAMFGGKTRFAILEALAEAKRPVTAYQIAMTKGLDPAATYRCLLEFSEFGVVE